MGPTSYSWEGIAEHLWQYFLEYPEQWPTSRGQVPERDIFFGWVKKRVEEYDRQMKNR